MWMRSSTFALVMSLFIGLFCQCSPSTNPTEEPSAEQATTTEATPDASSPETNQSNESNAKEVDPLRCEFHSDCERSVFCCTVWRCAHKNADLAQCGKACTDKEKPPEPAPACKCQRNKCELAQ